MPYPNGTSVSGSLTSATRGLSFAPGPGWEGGRYNLTVSGTFVATWRVVRSFDGGLNWFPASNAGAVQTFTGVFSEVLIEPSSNALVAVEITAYTSGTLVYAFGQ